MTCKHCGNESSYYVFIPFPNPAKRDVRDPKFAFHISKICTNCHGYFNGNDKTFEKQTPELMEELDHAVIMPKLNLQERLLPDESTNIS